MRFPALCFIVLYSDVMYIAINRPISEGICDAPLTAIWRSIDLRMITAAISLYSRSVKWDLYLVSAIADASATSCGSDGDLHELFNVR